MNNSLKDNRNCQSSLKTPVNRQNSTTEPRRMNDTPASIEHRPVGCGLPPPNMQQFVNTIGLPDTKQNNIMNNSLKDNLNCQSSSKTPVNRQNSTIEPRRMNDTPASIEHRPVGCGLPPPNMQQFVITIGIPDTKQTNIMNNSLKDNRNCQSSFKTPVNRQNSTTEPRRMNDTPASIEHRSVGCGLPSPNMKQSVNTIVLPDTRQNNIMNNSLKDSRNCQSSFKTPVNRQNSTRPTEPRRMNGTNASIEHRPVGCGFPPPNMQQFVNTIGLPDTKDNSLKDNLNCQSSSKTPVNSQNSTRPTEPRRMNGTPASIEHRPVGCGLPQPNMQQFVNTIGLPDTKENNIMNNSLKDNLNCQSSSTTPANRQNSTTKPRGVKDKSATKPRRQVGWRLPRPLIKKNKYMGSPHPKRQLKNTLPLNMKFFGAAYRDRTMAMDSTSASLSQEDFDPHTSEINELMKMKRRRQLKVPKRKKKDLEDIFREFIPELTTQKSGNPQTITTMQREPLSSVGNRQYCTSNLPSNDLPPVRQLCDRCSDIIERNNSFENPNINQRSETFTQRDHFEQPTNGFITSEDFLNPAIQCAMSSPNVNSRPLLRSSDDEIIPSTSFTRSPDTLHYPGSGYAESYSNVSRPSDFETSGDFINPEFECALSSTDVNTRLRSSSNEIMPSSSLTPSPESLYYPGSGYMESNSRVSRPSGSVFNPVGYMESNFRDSRPSSFVFNPVVNRPAAYKSFIDMFKDNEEGLVEGSVISDWSSDSTSTNAVPEASTLFQRTTIVEETSTFTIYSESTKRKKHGPYTFCQYEE